MVIKDEVLDMMCDPPYGQPDLYARLVRFCRQELPLAQQQGKVDEWVKAMARTPEYEAMAFGYRDQQEAPKELTTQRVERTSCPDCSGTGSVLMDGDCSDCNGKGYGWGPTSHNLEPAQDAVVEENRQLLLDRSRVGLVKYKTTLADAGLPRDQIVQHALEEVLDLANYLQTLLFSYSSETSSAPKGAGT